MSLKRNKDALMNPTGGPPEWFTTMVKESGLDSAPGPDGRIHINIDRVFKDRQKLADAIIPADKLVSAVTNIGIKK